MSNIGDGVLLASLPVLAASITDNRLSVGLIASFLTIPWLLFALPAGMFIDRMDRRHVLIFADLFRASLIGGLAVASVLWEVKIWMLWVLAFGLGTGEVFFDSGSQTILPALVKEEQLERANGLRYSVEVAGNLFIGAPLGALLFAVAVWLPFGVDAASFVVAAALASSLRGSFKARNKTREQENERRDWKEELIQGIAFIKQRKMLRGLVVAAAVTNTAFAMCDSTFVLFATRQLEVSFKAYGVFLAIIGIGTLIAGVVGAKVVNKLGRRTAMLVAGGGPILAMVAIGALPVAWWVVVMLTLNAGFGTIWSIVAVSLRQAVVPDELFGRVNSVYRWFSWGAMPVGAFLGGLMASLLGLRAPYFVAGGLMVLALVVLARSVTETSIEASIAENTSRT